MGNKRVALWDNLKFILIIMVVVGHFINIRNSVTYHSIFIFIYSVHMPLFIFLAGLFHKNEGIWKKAVAFLVIYILYELSIYGIKRAFGVKASIDMLHENSAPWFMLVMVYCIILGFLLHKLMEHKVWKWVVVGAFFAFGCFAGYITDIGGFLSLSKATSFIPFYFLGMALDRKKLEALAENKKLKISGVAVVAIWLIICLIFMKTVYQTRPYFVAREGFPETADFAFIWKLQCYLCSCVIGFFLIMATPTKDIKVITTWGSRTIQVYFWHKLVLYVFKYTDLDKWFYDGGVHKTLWIIVAVATTCLLSLKVFKFPTGFIMDLTRQKSDSKAK